MIVEEEQGGKKRAQYGKAQLQALSKKLTAQLGKGWSATNLEYMRKLFRVYSNSPIPQTGFEESDVSPRSVYPFRLSWSHYLVLMRMDNPDERRFYEIEAAENGWDLDELKRQFNSSLYERLALSRDKKGVLELMRFGSTSTAKRKCMVTKTTLEEPKKQIADDECELMEVKHA